MRWKPASGRCASGIRSPPSQKHFIADKLAKERKGKVAERNLRNTFVAAWAERPVSEITALDVLEIINTKKRTAPEDGRGVVGPCQAVLHLGSRRSKSTA